MHSNDELFFRALGARIAQLRKAQGYSQQAIADKLGLPQQTYAHYEVGRTRIPASRLPELGRMLGVTVDELLGLRNGARKRTPQPKLQKLFERVALLPHAKQDAVMRIVEAFLTQCATR